MGFDSIYLRKNLYIMYIPRIALIMNPKNPIAEISHTLGPLSAKIAMDEPTSNAETIKEMDN